MAEGITLAIAQLKRHEGKRNYVYEDKFGFATVGYGHNLDANGISDAAAEFMLREDVDAVVKALDEKLAWWRELDAARQAVVINMAFNLGVAGLLKFEKMLTALRAGQWDVAAQEMLGSLWARQVSKRAKELADVIATGVIHG